MEFYFRLCETVKQVRNGIRDEDWFEISHETFLESRRRSLEKLVRFLGVEPFEEYLDDCARIVWKEPRRTRLEPTWDRERIDLVNARTQEFAFLRGYTTAR